MRCPYCGDADSRVTDSRSTGEGIRRRRECSKCGVRFTTYERIQGAILMVAKRDGRREEFIRDKLLRSIRLACVKRPLPTGTLEKIVDEIESDLHRLGRAEIPSSVIGESTTAKLRDLDRVAYIRYASVYRNFDDLEEFQREIEALQSAIEESQREPAQSQLPLMPDELTAHSKPRTRRGRRPRISEPREAVDGAAPNP
jgi:transcriptional repressor NrdR